MRLGIALSGFLLLSSTVCAEPDAKRGYIALTTRDFTPAGWNADAFENLWKQLTPPLKEKPADFAQRTRDYYGLHTAPFEHGNLPMGLRYGSIFFQKGLTTDCMLCHGGSILGKSYLGLGNSALDIHSLFEDLNAASGRSKNLPFTFSNVRGTSEAANFAVWLHKFREPDLSFRAKPRDLTIHDHLCEDVPAWWLLKKKETMYFTGNAKAKSVRSIMQFMLTPPTSRATFDKEEATFADIQAYIFSLEAPKYPHPVDQAMAGKGKVLFEQNCAKCHGTYGEKWTYPNKVVPLEVIGTDPARLRNFDRRFGEFYNQSWFAQETGGDFKATDPKGYQAPPLDGIWATAPYLHNGSVPTLAGVLNSKARPKIFTRSFKTDAEAYDQENVGWKVRLLEQAPASDLPAIERRKVYDSTQPGRSNAGHTFGDAFTPEERKAVIEYLKTL